MWTKLILIISLLVAFVCPVYADTHTVTTCTAANINSAITAASAGDEVYLDCASGTVSTPVTIGKNITFRGRSSDYKNGTAGTTLTMSSTITISITGNTNVVFKDIKLTGSVSNGYFILNGSMNGFRVTNVWFDTGNYAVSTYGYQRGLFDNCRFTSIGSYGAVQFHIQEDNVAASYARPSSLGTANALFIEDCIIVGPSAPDIEWIMSQAGQGYVFRHNTISNYTLDIHGHCSYTGTRDFEIYENTWNATNDFNEGIIMIRGGTGVVYNNTVNKNGHTIWPPGIWMQEVYQGDMCNSATGGSCHCSSYPCTHQPGRGQNDTLDPIYFWNNKYDGVHTDAGLKNEACGSGCGCGGHDLTYFVQKNRDYYTSASTPKPGYAAYTYPHPLRGGNSSPAAPIGLEITLE